jgi:hypothetical protein
MGLGRQNASPCLMDRLPAQVWRERDGDHDLSAQDELDRPERPPMVASQAVRSQARLVVCRAVSGIRFPSIEGMTAGERAHQAVPGDLGDDRRAGNGVAAGIAPHHRGVLDAE